MNKRKSFFLVPPLVMSSLRPVIIQRALHAFVIFLALQVHSAETTANQRTPILPTSRLSS
jgi:hypothetical protein